MANKKKVSGFGFLVPKFWDGFGVFKNLELKTINLKLFLINTEINDYKLKIFIVYKKFIKILLMRGFFALK
ncbi:MAG: hypothetical protein COZ59_02870 [Bacteroidetes bacterium CG_4_8_14_3_um_filter_31_14]|nr:MAG: hypothetical protein COZ59_02870 [Bacteroidetes bacterium CG_4_8_14_3_um_filter_31_14]